MVDQPGNPYTYFGVTTFAQVDHCPLRSAWEADVAFLGVPFDQGAGFRSGTRFGPKAVRDISVRYRMSGDDPGYWDLRDKKHKGKCRLIDCGDVAVAPLDWELCFDNITRDVKHVLQRGAFPVVVGGDHSVTFPIVRAFEDQRPFTIVHFDAHTDYRDQVLGVRFGHGSVMRRCCELPNVENAYSIGIRSLRTLPGDIDEIQSRGNVIIPAWDVHDRPLSDICEQLPRGKRIYITFDIDAMDPGIAPGTGTPEVNGLQYRQARHLLQYLCANNKMIGFDLVEINPLFDPTQITALLGAQTIIETIGMIFPSAS